MPIDDLDDDGYPNDRFVPPSSRATATQPNNWTYPANWIPTAPVASPSAWEPAAAAANPSPVNPTAALRPDPFSPFGSLVPGGDLREMPWIPPTFPALGQFPPTPFPSLSGFLQPGPAGGLFGSLPDLQAAPSLQTPLPMSGLFSTAANLTAAAAPLGIPTLSAPQDPFAPLSGMQSIPNFSFSPFSTSPSQTNSSFTDQPSWAPALENPLGLASTQSLKFPMVGSLSSLGPPALLPTDLSAPLLKPQPLSFADQGGSPGVPADVNGSLLARILKFLNPISPAYAADDEGEIPPAEIEALLHLLNPELAKRLIEQNRFLEEFRKDLEEVRAGRASSRALARYLEISGVKRPPGYAAHHIVAGNDPEAEFARGVLKRFGIGINDAINGVFLPANRATQVIAGKPIHSTLHSDAYFRAVNEALKDVTTRQGVLDKLRGIASALEAGEYP